MYIVGFNGPPQSGKDTMARMLVEQMDSRVTLPCIEVSLSMPLRRIAYEMTSQIARSQEGHSYEAFKLQRFPSFGNKTGRELMIDISERFLKTLYGQDVMAKLLLQDLGDFPGIVLIRDTGFGIEAATLARAVGAHNFYVAQVGRANCDFSDDSREWVYHDFMGKYPNNGTLDDLRTEAGRLYGRLVNQLGWKL